MLRSLDAGLPKPRPSELGRGTLQSLLGLRQLCDLEACIQIYGKILHLDSLRGQTENHGVNGRPIETLSWKRGSEYEFEARWSYAGGSGADSRGCEWGVGGLGEGVVCLPRDGWMGRGQR